MKKLIVLLSITACCSLSGCATVFGGHISEYQRTKPLPGTPSRKVRPVPLITDIIFFPPALIVDFATGAIYRPQSAVK